MAEFSEEIGLDRFLRVAIEYYQCKYASNQMNLKDRAMAQWLDLHTYKEKTQIIEFMERRIARIKASQRKITHYFKPATHQKQQEESETHPEFKTAKKDKDKYQKYFENTYWKLRLEHEALQPEQIRVMVHNLWTNRKE